MNARGERVLIFGDSLSHPGQDIAPTIQEVTQGSNRPSSAPGDLLASMLLEQGAEAVRINAKVGRSAISFLSNEPVQQLIASDAEFRPTKVIVMLGTNDAERDLGKTETAMMAIRDAYKKMGAEVWAIGPMTYVGRGDALNGPTLRVLDVMQRVFGSGRTIDARPLSTTTDRTSDGIHFTATSARLVAPQLAQALLSANPLKKPLIGVALGLGGALLLGLTAWWINRRQSVAMEVSGSKVIPYHGYLISERSTGGFAITRSGKVVMPYAMTVDKAKTMINRSGLGGIKISKKDPAEMTASQINKELDRLSAEGSKINEKLIAEGRGHETYHQTYEKDDPLAQEFRRIHDRRSDLRTEISMRMGPGAPSRIPSGRFWASPRKKPGSLEGLGHGMLDTIARESKSPEEFALRAEAWAASESHPPTDKELALAYYRASGAMARIGTVMQLLRKARTKRQANTKARFQQLIRRPLPVEGLGVRPTTQEIAAGIREAIEAQVNTTSYGKKLKACDPVAMKDLTRDITGNLAMGVEGMIEDSLEP